ncbi:hypothetical protein M432DRAFT_436718 [Thermoascus aurantiacus ATCC 26904]
MKAYTVYSSSENMVFLRRSSYMGYHSCSAPFICLYISLSNCPHLIFALRFSAYSEWESTFIIRLEIYSTISSVYRLTASRCILGASRLKRGIMRGRTMRTTSGTMHAQQTDRCQQIGSLLPIHYANMINYVDAWNARNGLSGGLLCELFSRLSRSGSLLCWLSCRRFSSGSIRLWSSVCSCRLLRLLFSGLRFLSWLIC